MTRRAPVIQDFDGFLKVLAPNLSAGEYVLVLLYQRGHPGASLAELRMWVKPTMRNNLGRTLTRLVHDLAYVHADGDHYLITDRGIQYADENGLFLPP